MLSKKKGVRPKKKNMCLWSNCFSKIDVAMQGFFCFVFFKLVRFLNKGKRSEMVSVVSRYERNGIFFFFFFYSIQ